MLPEHFFVGANYWASNAGTFMWRNWDEKVVEEDFRRLSANGLEVLRVFPLWSDFQKLTDHLTCAGEHREFRYGEDPLPDTFEGKAAMDPVMLERFHTMCRLASKYGLKLIVGLLTGWMSGRLYAPPALEHRNLLTDPVAIKWEVQFVRCFVRNLKDEPAIAAWDWGNECNCLAKAENETRMWVWGQTITSAILQEDRSRLVISGLHTAVSKQVKAVGEVCDMLTTHPYPAFTPHCDVDYIDSFRSAFHAAIQTRWMADIGRKPAFVEEIGSFGPTITSDRIGGLYARNALWNCYAHSCIGFLWWCANDQYELEHTPYDWNSMERELGVIKLDGTPKPILDEMNVFGKLAAANPLPPHRTQAVVLQCTEGDHWGTAYMTALLAKQAGIDVVFYDGLDELPESDLYILPSVVGTQLFPRHRYLAILEKVKAGATLYFSSGYCGILPFGGFGTEIETIGRTSTCGRIISAENGLDLTVARTFAIRTGETSARVLARDEEGRPVFTCADYGKGKMIFLSMPLERSLMDLTGAFGEGAPDYAQIYRLIAREAGIKRVVESCDPLVTLTEHPLANGGCAVVAVNNSGKDKVFAPVIAEGAVVEKVVNGEETADGILLSAHGGAILYLRTQK